MTSNAIFRIITSLLISYFLVSCSSSSEDSNQKTESTTKAQKVQIKTAKERALARWNALITKDWASAYAFESPNYRKNYNQHDFMNSFGQAVTWVGIKHLATESINDTLSDVKLELTFNYDMSGNLMKIPSNISERWQFIENNYASASKFTH